MTTPKPRRVAQGGPPLVLLAAVFSALFLAGLIAGAALGDGTFPSPYASADAIHAYFAGNAAAVRTSAVLQFAAAVPLAILAATASARLHNLGIRAPGATIALAGGLLASAFLTLSALLQWLLSRPEVAAEPALVRALHDLTFLTGGPAHVAPLGLLVAGIAVPGLLVRLLPRSLAVAGLVIAAVAELSTLALVAPAFAVLLPLARFPALLWLIAAAALLPVTRRRP